MYVYEPGWCLEYGGILPSDFLLFDFDSDFDFASSSSSSRCLGPEGVFYWPIKSYL